MEFPGNFRKYIFLLVIVIIFGLFIFYRLPARKEIYAETRFFMDTTVTVKVVGEQKMAERAIEQAFKTMQEWAGRLDRFNSGSTVWRINHSGGEGTRVDQELLILLKKGKDYAALSKGAFDPTVAPLVDLWGFGQDEQRVPRVGEIERVLSRIDYEKLKLDFVNHQVFLPAFMEIDLGGMAKGFIIDKGIETLLALGVESAYINAGGNIRVLGNKAPGRPWRIGIRKPREPGKIFQRYILALNRGSLATSGDYERYFTFNGVRYSHLLDPRTGYPAREMQSATIYAENALEADILSTAVFVSGWDEGKRLIESLEGVEGFLVRENEVWMSKGLEKYLY